MIKKVINYYRNLSIVYKLFTTYISILSIPIILFIFINNIITSKGNENQILYSSKQALSQTNSFLQSNINSISDLLDIVCFNSTIQNLMYKNASSYVNDLGQWNADSNSINNVFYRLPSSYSLFKTHIYMKNGLPDFTESDMLLSLKKYEDSSWLKLLDSSNNISQWFPGTYFSKETGSSFVSIAKKVPNYDNLKEIIGVVRVDIPQDTLHSILNKAIITKSSSALIINNRNELISSSKENKYNNIDDLSKILSDQPLNNIDDNYWKPITLKNEKVLLGVQNIKKTDWKLIMLVPYTDILDMNKKSRMQLILIFLILVPFMLPVAFIVSSTFTKRISRLNRNMKKVEEGNLEIKINSNSNDEIGQLITNYNRMLSKLELLMEDKYKLGRKVKSLELKALQAQINPHFLYNTLDLINWMSIKYRTPEITTVVENLAKFYRLSLSRGEDIVSIKNELDHIIAYVQIQNLRHGNNISFTVNISEELLTFSILKLTLQPIIENCIQHGIMESEEECGSISIKGALEANTIILIIEDNGVGMDEYHLDNIFSGTISKSSSGYGIKNINDRLKLNYGEAYGLTYSSVLGQGTKVWIKIPAIKKE
jgi:Predicted signal transduction protein with a C-terminal ATPase domain